MQLERGEGTETSWSAGVLGQLKPVLTDGIWVLGSR